MICYLMNEIKFPFERKNQCSDSDMKFFFSILFILLSFGDKNFNYYKKCFKKTQSGRVPG